MKKYIKEKGNIKKIHINERKPRFVLIERAEINP